MTIFNPQLCELHVQGLMYASYPATIRRIELHAGADCGSAVVGWPQKYATPQSTKFGDRATITLGGDVIFRGCISGAPLAIGEDDLVELHLFDDKWLMSRNIIGQIGIGSQSPATLGFKDVGYEIVFNAEGRPNKDPDKLDFNLGSTAVFWTLKDILKFIFQYYIDTDVARLTDSVLGARYDRKPMSVNFIGQTALQAVDAIAELAGESWGLTPKSAASEFSPVRPGGCGRTRIVHLNMPKYGAVAATSTDRYIGSVTIDPKLDNVRDRIQIISGNLVRERVHTTAGANPLLVRVSGYANPDYKVQYKADVTAYAANGLGRDLSAGAKPKPWLPRLITRMNSAGSAYLTAADIVAAPAMAGFERAEIPVWIAADGLEANAKLVTEGYHIDCENGSIAFRDKLTVVSATAGQTEALTIANWAAAAIWMTVATQLETFEYYLTGETSGYLPKSFTQVVRKSDLIPERRLNAWLPNLTTGAITKVAVAEEKYIDIGTALSECLDSVRDLAPSIENCLSMEFDQMPVFNIGDLVQINGRGIGQSGSEVVTEIQYDVHYGYKTSVTATDVIAGAGERRKIAKGKWRA